MFCKNCGTQLPDGTKFCVKCGTKVEAEAAQPAETPVAETVAPAQETPAPEVLASEAPALEMPAPEVPAFEVPVPAAPAPEAPVSEDSAEPQPAFAQPAEMATPKKKKSKKFLAWLIPSVAVVVAAAVALVMFFDLGNAKGFFLKSFGSDVAYRDYVQENATKSATNTVSKAYGAAVTALSGENQEAGAADLSLKLNVGDKAITMLEDLSETELGEKISLDWARDVELKLSANAKDELQQIGAALNIGSKEIAVVDGILDMDQGKLFVAILNLSDEYLAVDFSEYLAMSQPTAMTELLQDSELIDALPSEEELNNLMNKYVNIAISSFDDVEKSTETVEVGDVEQKLTILDTKIDGDALLDAAEAILKEMSKDKDVKKIITRVVEYLADQEEFGGYIDADEVMDSYEDAIDEALDALKDVDGDDIPVEFVLSQYVNNAHEVVGFAAEVDGEQVRFVEIKDGDKIAFELKVPNALEIVGEGTEKKGVVNADYVVSVEMPTWDDDYNMSYEKMEILTISLVDFKAEGEAVNGKIRLAPSSALLDKMDLPASASSAISIAQLQLELGFATTEESSTVEINVLTGEELLVGVALTAAEKEASDIDVPNEAYDIDDVEDWLKTMDLEKILNALKEAGLPIDEVGELVFNSVKAEAQVPSYY